MGIFGWSYPPGAANDPNAPWNQEDPPCDVCGEFIENCVCPPCRVCGEYGDPRCYVEHGMRRTEMQKFMREVNERRWRDDAQAEADYWDDWYEEWGRERIVK